MVKKISRKVTAWSVVFSMLCLMFLTLVAPMFGITKAEAATGLTVHFKKPSTWNSAVKIYYWNVAPSGIPGSPVWPGVAMISEGNNWYKYTISGATSASIVFNDGKGKQTANLTRSNTEGWYYTDNKWYNYNPDSTSTPTPTPTPTATPTPVSTPTPTTFNHISIVGCTAVQESTSSLNIKLSTTVYTTYQNAVYASSGTATIKKDGNIIGTVNSLYFTCPAANYYVLNYNPFTMPSSALSGTYVCEYSVRDELSGLISKSSINFEYVKP